MGCFTACFRTWNHKRTVKPKPFDEETPLKNQPLSLGDEIEEAVKLLTAKSQEEEVTLSVNPISESLCTNEEQLHGSTREKVTFDDGCKNGLECNLVKNENESVESENERAEIDGSDSTASILVVKSNLEKNNSKKVEKERGIDQDNGLLGKVESCSVYCPIVSSTEQKASPGRACCDENGILKNLEECKKDDHLKGNVNGRVCDCGFIQEEEESSESLFSLSIDSRKHVFSSAEVGEKEVISPLKPLQSVSNSIENHSEKISVKVKRASITSMNHQEEEEEKENINLTEELGVKKHSDSEIAVETSLSSWLVESGKSYKNENSPSSVGNSSSERSKSLKSSGTRSVLEALTSEGFNESVSHQSHGSTEVSGIGTIGSYWRHTWSATDVD